jgi:type II secretory pathway pseudopilin PulG
MSRLPTSGDTIVEVLIAMAVASLILGASYATANRSFRIARQAQERGEALKLVEGQVEKLKSLAGSSPGSIFRAAGSPAFCIDTSLAVKDLPTAPPTPNPNLALDDFAQYVPPHTLAPGCQTGFYNYSITYDPASNDTFTILARWERIGGGRDELKMLYRLHP